MKHHAVNIATPPTTLPPLPGGNASPSRHCPPVCCHLTQNSRPVCVCVCVCVCVGGGGGGGGGGEHKRKPFLLKENQVMEQNQTPPPPSPIQCLMWWLSLHQDLEKLVKPQILQLEVEDSKKNRSLLDKHYFKTTNRWSIFWLTSNSLDITGILKTF